MSGPTYLQIEPTTRCNLRCRYCVGWRGPRGDMSSEMFERVLAQADSLRYVALHGEGEPFMHPDYLEMVDRLRQAGVEVSIITNGRFLERVTVRRLVELEVSSVGVSVDSLDPETYDWVCQSDLQTVLDGLERLLATRRDSTRPDVHLCAVLMNRTIDGIPRLVEFSRARGMSPPFVQALQQMPDYLRHYPTEVMEEIPRLTHDQADRLNRYCVERAQARSRAGVQTYYESLCESQRNAACPFLAGGLYVRFDGAVFPCCFVKEESEILGHLERGQTLDDIWGGSARREVLEGLAVGRIPHCCRHCRDVSR